RSRKRRCSGGDARADREPGCGDCGGSRRQSDGSSSSDRIRTLRGAWLPAGGSSRAGTAGSKKARPLVANVLKFKQFLKSPKFTRTPPHGRPFFACEAATKFAAVLFQASQFASRLSTISPHETVSKIAISLSH